MPPSLGILAGGGSLPGRLVEVCRHVGRPVRLVAFSGQTDDAVAASAPHVWARLGAVRPALDWLRDEGVREVCLAGSIRRPSLSELRPDAWTARLLARAGLFQRGDDALLRLIREALEREGFELVGAHDLLDGLLARPGLLTATAPDEQAWRDIVRGFEAACAVGALDIGQAAVVQQGMVLAVEAAEGTDAMVRRAGELRRAGPGGVLVKACKPGQDGSLDLPTIGTATVEAAAAAGLRGIAVEAGASYIVDAEAVAAAADRLGLFVVGLDAAR